MRSITSTAAYVPTLGSSSQEYPSREAEGGGQWETDTDVAKRLRVDLTGSSDRARRLTATAVDESDGVGEKWATGGERSTAAAGQNKSVFVGGIEGTHSSTRHSHIVTLGVKTAVGVERSQVTRCVKGNPI